MLYILAHVNKKVYFFNSYIKKDVIIGILWGISWRNVLQSIGGANNLYDAWEWMRFCCLEMIVRMDAGETRDVAFILKVKYEVLFWRNFPCLIRSMTFDIAILTLISLAKWHCYLNLPMVLTFTNLNYYFTMFPHTFSWVQLQRDTVINLFL